MTALLRARGIGHRFGTSQVLCDVDLELAPGELRVVVGPNGAGKTTLLRALAGVLAPGGGSIELMGAPLDRQSRRQIARSIAVVAQEIAIPFPYSVREVVAMGRAPYLGPFGGESDSDRRIVADAIECMQLEAFAERSFPTLSAGEKQRVALASAFAQQPAVLLLDEPTAHMDLGHGIETFERLREWIKSDPEKRAVLLVTHDLVLAARFADRVSLLAQGRLAADGSPEQVLTRERIAETYAVDASVSLDADGRLVIVARRRIDYTARPDEPDR